MSSTQIVCWPGASGNASVFDGLVCSLSPSRRLMVLDYPGLGASPPSAEVGSLDELYRYIVGQLPSNPCDLIAVSMGCGLALRAALEIPERIRRLVLIAAAGGIDVLRFGAQDWREGWATRRPEAPRWFIDDRSDYGSRLGTIQIPTLLVFGDRDAIAPRTVGEYLRTQLPHATLEVLAGATHDLLEERAGEIASLIVRHLRD